MDKKYKLEFSKEEMDILILQVGARLDYFEQLQMQEARNGNVKRVIGIEKNVEPLKTALNKIRECRYR